MSHLGREAGTQGRQRTLQAGLARPGSSDKQDPNSPQMGREEEERQRKGTWMPGRSKTGTKSRRQDRESGSEDSELRIPPGAI